jgi:hypothetical protein
MGLPGLLMDAFGRLPHLLGKLLSSRQESVEAASLMMRSFCHTDIYLLLLGHKLLG